MSDENERSVASDGSTAWISVSERQEKAMRKDVELSPLLRVVMTTGERLQRFEAALDDMLQDAHQRGLVEGLAVATKIRDWLTRQPDRKWQRQVREWADAEIAKAERKKA